MGEQRFTSRWHRIHQFVSYNCQKGRKENNYEQDILIIYWTEFDNLTILRRFKNEVLIGFRHLYLLNIFQE